MKKILTLLASLLLAMTTNAATYVMTAYENYSLNQTGSGLWAGAESAIYLKFNTSIIPTNETVISSRLVITSIAIPEPSAKFILGGLDSLNVFALLHSWKESRPPLPNDQSEIYMDYNLTVDGQSFSYSGSELTFNVELWRKYPEFNDGMGVTSPLESGGMFFYNRQSVFAPKLIVETIPEPSPALLLATLTGGLLSRRRRA